VEFFRSFIFIKGALWLWEFETHAADYGIMPK
jgi:hypothetical protein